MLIQALGERGTCFLLETTPNPTGKPVLFQLVNPDTCNKAGRQYHPRAKRQYHRSQDKGLQRHGKKTANGSIPGPITVRYLADLELSESVDVTQKYCRILCARWPTTRTNTFTVSSERTCMQVPTGLKMPRYISIVRFSHEDFLFPTTTNISFGWASVSLPHSFWSAGGSHSTDFQTPKVPDE